MKKYFSISLLTGTGLIAGMLVALPALAQVNVSASASVQGGWDAPGGMQMHESMQPGIFGTVTAINGSTLTVTGMGRPPMPMPMQPQNASSGMKMWQRGPTSTIYTVDASNAQVYKGSPTSTVSFSEIAVNDKVLVQGTVSGTSVTATVIRDGFFPPAPRPGFPHRGFGNGSSSTSTAQFPVQGNGEPVIGGNVTAINGTTLTVTNASNVTYTIDISGATIVKRGATTTASNIATGDAVVIQGVVNGNSVAASSVIDQGVHAADASSTAGVKAGAGFGFGGIFNAIGGFFKHIFGF